MATMRDIKRRIRAVENTKQITRAMYMVAAARLKRSEGQVKSARPYSRQLVAMLERLGRTHLQVPHPLLEPRDEAHSKAYVLFTGDRGLCGSYNANLIRFTESVLEETPGQHTLVAVGRKGRDYFRRRGVPFLAEFTGIGDVADITFAKKLARGLMDAFVSGQVDEVNLVFSEFISPLSQRPKEVPLLPLGGFRETGAAESTREETRGKRSLEETREYIYEPSPAEVFANLLPRFVEVQVYHALMEAKASEHGARMTAMKNATDNAEDLIRSLTLDYNRARQAAITKEIAEIVGGAEALKG